MVENTLMNDSKKIILNRIQAALRKEGGRNTPLPSIVRNYQTQSDMPDDERLTLFMERVSDYKAKVALVDETSISKTIEGICIAEHAGKLVVPQGLERNWLPDKESGISVTMDGNPSLTTKEIDQNDAVLTGCYRAVAQTGTIVMTSGAGQGRRILTLLPDLHICVVLRSQITGIIPEVFSDLALIVKEKKSPVTFISGPSATSDIELDRVEGVHGPRRLHVLII